MALSKSQYDQLMRDYEQLQLDNEHELRLRFDEVYAKIPKLRTIDDTISSLSVEKAKRLLEGDEDALSSFHEKLLTLTGEKQKLLTSHGFPSDYLEKHYLSRLSGYRIYWNTQVPLYEKGNYRASI